MLHTRNDWYVACRDGDLDDGGPIAMSILDEPLAIWRSAEKVVALEDRCVHRAAALSLGRCEGATLRCMYHGLLFDDAGRVVEIPGQEVVPPNARVRAYPAASRYGLVWVWMGDPARADPGLLPELFPGVGFDDYEMRGGVMDFEAEAQLISDNLLDFSHIPYVHESSFQSPPVWARTTMNVKQLKRGVRFERWMENGESGAFLFGANPEPIDEWLCYDYLVPGVLIMWIAVFPKGTARSIGFERPDFSLAVGQVNLHIQAVTPMTERRSRYHFAAGLHRQLGGDLSLMTKFVDVNIQAFKEDKRMIEAQQRVIDRDPQRPLMPTVHDRGVTLYHRLKDRLVAEERGRLEVDAGPGLAP